MFDDILADCIEALAQGATIRECLTRYPAHATTLEPLLRLVVSLSRESQTRLSSSAFVQGRQALAAHARQRWTAQNSAAAQHRHPTAGTPVPPKQRRSPARTGHNGLPQAHRTLAVKRSWWSLGMPRLLSTTLFLLLFVGVTTLLRQVITSLPGTPFYPLKSTGEQVMGVLMEAAGEDIAWHGAQAERHLQELARLPHMEQTTVQTLAQAVEEHWDALLTASERLPVAARAALLQSRITRLQQLEAQWTTPQDQAQQAALATVRRLISVGGQALDKPAPIENQPAMQATPVATMTPTAASAIQATPTTTPTPVLQASATVPTIVPILVASPTPTLSPTVIFVVPDTATPLPTLPVPVPTATPMPEITVQMPRQETSSHESSDQPSDENNAAEAEATTTVPTSDQEEVATATPSSVTTPVDENATATSEPVLTATTVATPGLTPSATAEQPVPTATESTPQATATVENTPAPPAKATPSAVATPEPATTATPRPPAQATASKTPKPTATPAEPVTATPNATGASPTVATTAQPTSQPSVEPAETPASAHVTPIFAQPLTPRPTAPSGEGTRVAP